MTVSQEMELVVRARIEELQSKLQNGEIAVEEFDAEVDKLSADLRKLDADSEKLSNLQDGFLKGKIAAKEYREAMVPLAASVQQTRQEIERTVSATQQVRQSIEQTVSGGQAGGFAGWANRTTNSARQLAFALQDLATGASVGNLRVALLGASNNLQMLAMTMMGPMAGAMTGVGLGLIPLVANAVEALTKKLIGATDASERFAKTQERLAKIEEQTKEATEALTKAFAEREKVQRALRHAAETPQETRERESEEQATGTAIGRVLRGPHGGTFKSTLEAGFAIRHEKAGELAATEERITTLNRAIEQLVNTLPQGVVQANEMRQAVEQAKTEMTLLQRQRSALQEQIAAESRGQSAVTIERAKQGDEEAISDIWKSLRAASDEGGEVLGKLLSDMQRFVAEDKERRDKERRERNEAVDRSGEAFQEQFQKLVEASVSLVEKLTASGKFQPDEAVNAAMTAVRNSGFNADSPIRDENLAALESAIVGAVKAKANDPFERALLALKEIEKSDKEAKDKAEKEAVEKRKAEDEEKRLLNEANKYLKQIAAITEKEGAAAAIERVTKALGGTDAARRAAVDTVNKIDDEAQRKKQIEDALTKEQGPPQERFRDAVMRKRQRLADEEGVPLHQRFLSKKETDELRTEFQKNIAEEKVQASPQGRLRELLKQADRKLEEEKKRYIETPPPEGDIDVGAVQRAEWWKATEGNRGDRRRELRNQAIQQFRQEQEEARRKFHRESGDREPQAPAPAAEGQPGARPARQQQANRGRPQDRQAQASKALQDMTQQELAMVQSIMENQGQLTDIADAHARAIEALEQQVRGVGRHLRGGNGRPRGR